MTGATIVAGTVYLSGAPEFTCTWCWIFTITRLSHYSIIGLLKNNKI